MEYGGVVFGSVCEFAACLSSEMKMLNTIGSFSSSRTGISLSDKHPQRVAASCKPQFSLLAHSEMILFFLFDTNVRGSGGISEIRCQNTYCLLDFRKVEKTKVTGKRRLYIRVGLCGFEM